MKITALQERNDELGWRALKHILYPKAHFPSEVPVDLCQDSTVWRLHLNFMLNKNIGKNLINLLQRSKFGLSVQKVIMLLG